MEDVTALVLKPDEMAAVRTVAGMLEQFMPGREGSVKPSVGRIVHYVSYGTPGGEYGKECRAAIVTEVNGVPTGPHGEYKVGLCVLNPTGQFFNRDVEQDEGAAPPDGGALVEVERPYQGGTWHWPERVD